MVKKSLPFVRVLNYLEKISIKSNKSFNKNFIVLPFTVIQD